MSAGGAASYLGEDDIADIRAVQADGFATRLELKGIAVRLYRGRDAVTTEPVPVVIELANRQSRGENGAGALDVALSAGTVSSWAPWDVERGDTFRYGTATAVIRDVLPDNGLIQMASFEVMDGGGVNG